MAGYKGKTETISSVSDILGFVLEQSELPPEERRPVKPPKTADTQASSEYVQTLVDALAMPGMFVGDKYLETIEGLVNPTIAIGAQAGPLPDVKISAGDLPEFFENPDKFVDKLFEKSRTVSKMQRLRWAGEQMRALTGSTYAKKAGLFDDYDKDLKPVLERALGQVAMDSGNERDKQWIADASAKLRGAKLVKGKINELRTKIGKSTDDKQLQKWEDELDSIGGMERLEQLESRRSGVSGTEYKRLEKRIEGVTKGLTDTTSFKKLLGMEFTGQGEKILGGREYKDLNSKERDSYNKVKSAENTLGLWSSYEKLDHRGMKDKWSEVTRQRKKIFDTKQVFRDRLKAIESGAEFSFSDGKTVDYGKLSSSDRQKEKSYINQNLKQLTTTEKSLTSVYLWSKLGQAEGLYHGLKQTFGPGGVEAMLNGDFFNPNKGYFGCPSEKGTVSLLKDEKLKSGSWHSVNFMKSKSADVEGKMKLTDNYNNMMVQLYYLNPTTWVKTAFNGEGFAWISDNAKMKWVKYKKLDPNSALAKKFRARMKRFEGLSEFFSTPTRLYNRVMEGTIGKMQKNLRNKTYKILSSMKFFTNSEAAKSLLRTWKATGGASLSAAIAQGVLTALGAASSVIAGPLGAAATFVVSMILEKVAKVSIKVFIYALVGVFGGMLLLASFIEYGDRAQVDSYSREIPGTIYENPEFVAYGGYFSDWFHYDDDFIPPPINVPAPTNSSCPLGDVKYRCSQGFTRTTCSHKNITNKYPVDLTGFSFFYAPQYCDTSTCTATMSSVAAWRCSDGSFTGRNIMFNDGQGNIFNLMHTKLLPPSNGRSYKAGEPVAYIYQYAAEMVADDPLGITRPNKNGVFYCWTGAHLHLTITHNGRYIDPIEFLVDMGCTNGVQSESKCPPCKAE